MCMDNGIFSFDEIEIEDDIIFDPDRAAWDRLIDQIIRGNVIPVIGPDILYDGGNIHKKLIDSLAAKFKIESHPRSFSELVFDHDYLKKVKDDKDSIYHLINQIFTKKRFSPSSILYDILSIRQFPFVITTSFTPIVEQVMEHIWKKELRIMRFNNNPRENDDIKPGTDIRKPTLYYMFGRVGDGAHRYALTDTDMLDFCSSWLSDTNFRPRTLVSELKDKYLLMLGNNYSDWLFRFIWYSIRKNNNGGGMYAYEDVDDELSRFLERNHTFLMKNPKEVVSQIKKRLEEKLKNQELTKFNQVENDVDIFISYSRSDSDIADTLYTKLTAMGKRVWYDKHDITSGGDFMNEIRKGIRTAKYFLPILSKHIELEKKDKHIYRNEWDVAIQVAISLGRTYIIPVANKDFNYYNSSIPDKLQQHNAILYDENTNFDNLAELIVHTMNEE